MYDRVVGRNNFGDGSLINEAPKVSREWGLVREGYLLSSLL